MKMNENIHKNIYSENNKTNLENPISLEIKGFRERINLLLERSNITLSFKEKKEIIELLNTDKNISLYKKNDEIIKKLLDKNELNFNYEEVKEKLIELKKLLPNSDLVFSSNKFFTILSLYSSLLKKSSTVIAVKITCLQ